MPVHAASNGEAGVCQCVQVCWGMRELVRCTGPCAEWEKAACLGQALRVDHGNTRSERVNAGIYACALFGRAVPICMCAPEYVPAWVCFLYISHTTPRHATPHQATPRT